MLRLHKPDHRHRALGWWYVVLMTLSLAGAGAAGCPAVAPGTEG